MTNGLPTLRIVPTVHVHLHEEFDENRTRAIAAEMRRQKLLTNPPIVAPIAGRRAYVLLDGANRVTAARRIGLPHLLVQVVDYDDPGIILSEWAHVVGGFPADTFFREVAGAHGEQIEQVSVQGAFDGLRTRAFCCFYHHRARGTFALRHPPGRGSDVGVLRAVTGVYKDRASIVRVFLDAGSFASAAAGENLVLAFPLFSKADIVRCSLSPHDKLPTGISRHTIPGRALRVNLPLRILRSKASLAEKNRALGALVRERARRNAIRLYSEPTFLYDD